MIGECSDINDWKDINGVNPQIGDMVKYQCGYRGLAICKIEGVNNSRNDLTINLGMVGTYDCGFSVSKIGFSKSCEIILKFNPKYKRKYKRK